MPTNMADQVWRTWSIFSCSKGLWDVFLPKPITTKHQSVFWLVSQSRRMSAICVGSRRWISLAAACADPVVRHIGWQLADAREYLLTSVASTVSRRIFIHPWCLPTFEVIVLHKKTLKTVEEYVAHIIWKNPNLNYFENTRKLKIICKMISIYLRM